MQPRSMTPEGRNLGAWSLPVAVMLALLPVLHPLLRPQLGPPSHLLWFAHVLPVAMASYLYGFRGLLVAISLGVIAVVAGESTFGAGYGVPADAATIWSLAVATGATEFLVGAFALWVRRVETERARLERLAVAGLDASQDAVLLLDREGRVQYANSAAREMLAVASQDLQGCRFWSFMVVEEHGTAFEPVDGARRTVLARSMVGRVFPVELRISAVRGAAGEIVAWLVAARDRSEELRSEEGRRREQALGELGALVAGIAHELNNPLTSVVTYSELLVQENGLPAEVEEALQVVAHEGRRAARIARQLLDKVRKRKVRLEPFDLNRIVAEAVRARRVRFAAHGITVSMDLQAELPPVAGKPTEVEQIVANLLANAEEAMYSAHGGGALKVETRLEGEALILIVQDDGPGIPADVLPRIFEPFFTTKGERGTGLGLAIARRIAREAGGDLEAGNAPTSGARFVLRLPVAVPGVSSGKAPSVAQKGPPLPPAPKSRLQILVVDDEPHIRGALGRFLERQGHRVVLASDFSEAVKSIEAFGFDAILCDVHLPGGTGMKLYTFLRSRRAELRCRFVLMTGDTLGGDVAAFLARHRIPYLAKPFELSEVSRVLDTLVTEPECLESEEQVAGSGGMAE